MGKKKSKPSKNEEKAAKAGMSVKEYNKSKSSKNKSSSKSKDSKDEKKAKKQTKEYYEKQKVEEQAAADLKTKRLKEDLDNIYKEAGIAQTRAMEDYSRNIGNIESNKAADLENINYYVKNQTGRVGEDLTTSLNKESRRFSLELDKVNQDLAARGMSFSERTPEQIAKGGNVQNTADINLEANRSFADVARYEAAQTANVALVYGQQTTAAESTQTRTLEDIINAQNLAIQSNTQGTENAAITLSENLTDINYASADALSNISNSYDVWQNSLNNANTQSNAIGV